MINLIEQFLNKYKILSQDKTIIVGFSGGYDSMCLLDILSKLSETYKFKLIAAHLNHNWRGEESLKDAQNCEQFCAKRSIIFHTETLSANEKHTETRARELRYDYFNRVIKYYNADALLTAHTKSDIAETLIYRLIKGTGIKGLQGISPNINKIFRPMLNISRADVENYCKNNNLLPNFDSSNNNNKYARNFIRNKILKLFKELNSNYENSLNSLSNLAFEEEQIIKEYINTLNLYENDKILTQKFINQSLVVKKRIVYEIFVKYTIEYTQEKVLNTLNFINETQNSKSGKKYSLNSDKWLFVSNKIIQVITKSQKNENIIKINSEGTYEFDDYIFTIKKCDKTPEKFPIDIEYEAYIELNKPINFELRTRISGDKIMPLGSNCLMKFKKYLISKNIPQHEKDTILLLCEGSEILWASGLGLSNKIKVVNKCTHVLTLKKKGGTQC